jgi:hypothetical protein
MSASTNLSGDVTTVISNGPNAATKTKNANPNGPIIDYTGVLNSMFLDLEYLKVLSGTILAATDSTDSSNVTALTAVNHALYGGGSPSGTLLTGVQGVITAGPNAATLTKAANPNGPIMDYIGNVNGLYLGLKECLVRVKTLIASTDSTDTTNLGLLQGLQTALS